MKKKGQAYSLLLVALDLAITAGSWVLAYWLRFDLGYLPVPKGRPPFAFYLISLSAILPIWAFTFNAVGLYDPTRIKSLGREYLTLIKGVLFAVAALSIFSFFYREIEFSRLVILVFFTLDLFLLGFGRTLFRRIVVSRYRRGLGVKRLLLIGRTEAAASFIARVRHNPWMGIDVVGLLENDQQGTQLDVPILGSIDELSRVVEQHAIDQVAIALPFDRFAELKAIFQTLSTAHLTVRIIPDLFQFDLMMNASVDSFDGLPVINLVDSPMVGVNAVAKRLFDLLFSLVFLSLFSPIYLLLALLVKLTSRGPALYRQERMGLDGRLFKMVKFRTMPVDAEKDGPHWATADDDRSTAFGGFLRRTSLDELPQFINVLLGEMSVVGPRPERPVFIEEFKQRIPRYNLRHKIKAGITGWAQINGWRGDTSIEKRIEHDLFYIENWSLGFDLKIIFLTLFRGLLNKNAY